MQIRLYVKELVLQTYIINRLKLTVICNKNLNIQFMKRKL
jgi:hypothetical protein